MNVACEALADKHAYVSVQDAAAAELHTKLL
jgi:hypothetical protein